jgi:hypothetical protein
MIKIKMLLDWSSTRSTVTIKFIQLLNFTTLYYSVSTVRTYIVIKDLLTSQA